MTPAVRLLAYDIPLAQPLRLNSAEQPLTLNSRQGLLLHWRFADAECFTEIAPLPGFSDETLEQARAQVTGLGVEYFQQNADLSGLYPSVRFAIEAAWYQQSHPLQNKRANCCAFGAANSEAEWVKIKVGHQPFDLEALQLLSLAPQQWFRLDANRHWSLQDLSQLQKSVDLQKLDYIEEPLADLNDYEQLSLPFAFDESLRDYRNPAHLPEVFFKAKAWVVKPMLTGLQRTLQLVELAKTHGIELVLSSSFESHITLEFYHSLACDLQLSAAQGLDTLHWLENDLMAPRLSLRERPVELAPLREVAVLC